MRKNNWTVLLVGGSSGIGKSQLTRQLAKKYGAKIIEADDICNAVKAMTTADIYPAIHYWISDIDWTKIGVMENVDYLSKVSDELSPGLRKIVDNHLRTESPLIIEGDFISVEFAASFNNPKVQAIYVYESEKSQIIENYLRREGGAPQDFRASISVAFGRKLQNDCDTYGVNIVESRPWNTLLDRVITRIDKR